MVIGDLDTFDKGFWGCTKLWYGFICCTSHVPKSWCKQENLTRKQ